MSPRNFNVTQLWDSICLVLRVALRGKVEFSSRNQAADIGSFEGLVISVCKVSLVLHRIIFSATNEIIKISDPSQSLVPAEEAPLQRFERLKVNFTLS